MEKSYDSYEPFNKVKLNDFNFRYQKFDIWSNGKIEASITNTAVIEVRLNPVGGYNIKLPQEILTVKEFNLDTAITQTDRIQLITVPISSNNEAIGLSTLRMMFGDTSFNEAYGILPYCLSVFSMNGLIVKLSISFSNPEKLVEFFTTDVEISNEVIYIAIVLLELLVSDYDSDGAYTSLSSVNNYLLSQGKGSNISKEKLNESINLINSIHPKNSDLVRKVFRIGMLQSVYTSNYSKATLNDTIKILKGMI